MVHAKGGGASVVQRKNVVVAVQCNRVVSLTLVGSVNVVARLAIIVVVVIFVGVVASVVGVEGGAVAVGSVVVVVVVGEEGIVETVATVAIVGDIVAVAGGTMVGTAGAYFFG
jgi:hypothetical protein